MAQIIWWHLMLKNNIFWARIGEFGRFGAVLDSKRPFWTVNSARLLSETKSHILLQIKKIRQAKKILDSNEKFYCPADTFDFQYLMAFWTVNYFSLIYIYKTPLVTDTHR